jgi:signal transduction histidine kinase
MSYGYMVIPDNINIIGKCLKKKYIIYSIVILYLTASLFLPELAVFIPLLCFDIMMYCRQFMLIPAALCIAFSVPHIHLYIAFSCFILFGMSIFSEYLLEEKEQLDESLRQLRDTSVEHDILAKENMRILQINQDNMIYAATLKERNRIAREIHDNVGHMLTRSILQAGAIKTINKDEMLAPHLDSLQDTLNTAMTSIRSSVHDLHDEAVDLKVVMEELVNSEMPFHINLDYDMKPHVPHDIKYSFIAIVKEAVTNVEKHSNATVVNIKLHEHPGFYQLMIEDNGTTTSSISYTEKELLKQNAEVFSGIGLRNIVDRVHNLNGHIKITNDKGFKIFISIMKQEM